MLEILAVWLLTKKVGKIVEAKGHRPTGYKILTVVLWIVGEIFGAVIGVIIAGFDESSQCLVYLIGLGGAVVGGGIAYLIAASLTPNPEGVAMLASQGKDPVQALILLKKDLDAGRITQEEFEEKKKDVLKEM